MWVYGVAEGLGGLQGSGFKGLLVLGFGLGFWVWGTATLGFARSTEASSSTEHMKCPLSPPIKHPLKTLLQAPKCRPKHLPLGADGGSTIRLVAHDMLASPACGLLGAIVLGSLNLSAQSPPHRHPQPTTLRPTLNPKP